MDNRGENRSQPDHQPGSRVDRTACNPLADREGMSAAIEAGFDHVHWGPKVAMSGLSNTRPAETLASLSSEGEASVLAAAVNQNDAMRQELANVGNLVSDLARVMGVDQANDDGSWPDLAGRIQKLIASTPSQSDVIEKCGEDEAIEAMARAMLKPWVHRDFNEQELAGARKDAAAAYAALKSLASKEGQL